jgi:hypothetical protein
MSLHIAVPSESSSNLRLNDAECAAFARRRRWKMLLVLGLSALSWLLIGTLIVSVA